MTFEENLLDYNTFLRSFKVMPNNAFDFFLGSGASVTSGIPTGNHLTWYFKREILCSVERTHTDKYKDLFLEDNQRKIQSFFDGRKDKERIGNDGEYSYYFKECFPDGNVRKEFLTNLVRDKKPSIGFLCLSKLIESQKSNTVWTTNFDDLIEKAINAMNFVSCSIISPENASSIQTYKTDIPKVIKLHGDFRYDPLQNTKDELKYLESSLQEKFLASTKSKGLIVIGYSGNDQSIMSVLAKAINEQDCFPNGLIWCLPRGIRPSEELIELISVANDKNQCSGFLQIDNFDYFLFEIYKYCGLQADVIDNIAANSFERRKPFRIIQAESHTPPILLNCIKVKEYPKSIFAAKTTINSWKDLRSINSSSRVIAALHKGDILTWGDENEIKEIYRPHLKEDFRLSDIPEKALYYVDSVYLGLMYDLVENSLVKEYKLTCFSRGNEIRKYYSKDIGISEDEISRIRKWNRYFSIPAHLSVFEAFEFKIEFYDNTLFLFILPTVHIERKDGTEASDLDNQLLSNTILSNRYNEQYNSKLVYWLNELKRRKADLTFSLGKFKISLESFYCTGGAKVDDSIYSFERIKFLSEPKIYFHHSDRRHSSIHPLAGLKTMGPLEESYGGGNRLDKIKMGVIAPASGFDKVLSHLNSLKNPTSPTNEKDYIKEYPGFDELFKKHLDIPVNSQSQYCVSIPDDEVVGFNPIQFYDYLKRCLDVFIPFQTEVDCIAIYIPEKWKDYREQKTLDSYFDLHDSIKLYCVKKGLKVQFIEDKSINYSNQAKIRWWLSLGLFVKSNSTPWKIDADEVETAYIGLSYAIRRNAREKVVLGSSQIFDSNGSGLKFLLQPIEKPIYYGKNPFMSKEDAFKLTSAIRNTYHKIDPNYSLKKMVFHKTVHFTKDEIEGICNALEGIDNIELLQIQQFSSWRAVKLFKDNATKKHKPASYPVNRGTVLQIDDFSFLLWTHGTVNSADFVSSYYQGKRGVPGPLLVKRFLGKDSIETVANDIMKLTKMNWNGAELYKTLPVTIDFSKKLSVISKQSEELTNKAYDFRYFI